MAPKKDSQFDYLDKLTIISYTVDTTLPIARHYNHQANQVILGYYLIKT